jgi:DNA-binding NarL/FixJ family response regulator
MITSTKTLRVALATSRPAVHAFLAGLPGVVLEPAEQARVGVVDVVGGSAAAVGRCRELRADSPELPLVAILCCPRALSPWQLQTLLGEGVGSVLDLQLGPGETLRALERAASGGSVLDLQLWSEQRSLLRELFERRPANATDLRVLELVSLGLPDHEIGRRLHLSPHTVKHHVESLRGKLGVRNRIELAAWAGRHGFYPT